MVTLRLLTMPTRKHASMFIYRISIHYLKQEFVILFDECFGQAFGLCSSKDLFYHTDIFGPHSVRPTRIFPEQLGDFIGFSVREHCLYFQRENMSFSFMIGNINSLYTKTNRHAPNISK